jgi:tRNA(Arg) A34 adenosine deaminase TadA
METSFMRRAIELARENVKVGGGPFGAVIVKEGTIISEGVNQVTSSCDPTAHAEIVAIRHACSKLNTFHLQGCVIYTSCEPCPMCLAACYWARLDQVVYCANREDAANAGFDDKLLYAEMNMDIGQRKLSMTRFLPEEAHHPFHAWKESPYKVMY